MVLELYLRNQVEFTNVSSLTTSVLVRNSYILLSSDNSDFFFASIPVFYLNQIRTVLGIKNAD